MTCPTRTLLATAGGLLAAALLASAPPAEAAGDLPAGKAKAQQCAVCHGLDGLARQPDAPHLAGESDIYLAKQLQAFRSGERQHQIMSIIAQGLSDQDIADLAAWYSAIRVTAEPPEVP